MFYLLFSLPPLEIKPNIEYKQMYIVDIFNYNVITLAISQFPLISNVEQQT